MNVLEPGSFASPMQLFLEDNGIRLVILNVRGTGVAAGSTDDAKGK